MSVCDQAAVFPFLGSRAHLHTLCSLPTRKMARERTLENVQGVKVRALLHSIRRQKRETPLD